MQTEVETQIYEKLGRIEGEIEDLRTLLLQGQQIPKRVVSLGGLFKGVGVTEEDIKEAKSSLFKVGI
ncbi:MAG: hypothetical protein BME93_05910 [Methanosarcinales archaeon Met12]|nr:MAG: hypothetical protein BME93_05910 [Methanosarcinales archaeon Met12]